MHGDMGAGASSFGKGIFHEQSPTPWTMASHNVPRPAINEPRTEKQRQAELQEISAYKLLVDLIDEHISRRQYTAELLQHTTELLTKNPEYYTIWNVRKRCLTYGLFSKSLGSSLPSNPLLNTSQIDTIKMSAGNFSSSTSMSSEGLTTTQEDQNHPSLGRNGTTLELIQKDLNFLVPLIRKWPKCYWLWDHRMWLLHEATRRLEAPVARRLWEEDMSLVGMMLVKDSRNFLAWNYRRIVIAELEGPGLNGSSMVESEFEYTTKMIKANLSNFSAWHNRSKLIPRLLNERDSNDAARQRFLDEEFDIMKNALWVDSADQSLWFYYQFLLATIISPAAYDTIVPGFKQADRIEYIDRQLIFLKDLLDGAEDSKWIYTAMIDCTSALWDMKGHQIPPEAMHDLKTWLDNLRKLDPLRNGRWNELSISLDLKDC